ncbi:endonuclease/exonuclease/phosphatase family protein [Bremerella sp. T1]|uniref:endonuclease/exonuclease/phosphatase family protein n=1 Tax=Bremerella sp. TYQ1 TaxID=3119568 RepID=UPI001CCDAAD4|nr:endonuclease/exonuclease/phosphatase family protein [Bremerella volcania]UBM34281.1 endonuclease/exonuclease/phosphatase family protein [Bremerella volcania]
MKRTSALLLAVIAGAGAWFFFQNYRIEGIDNLVVVPRDAATAKPAAPAGDPMVAVPAMARKQDSIRIASFNIQVFGTAKMEKPEVMSRLAEIIRQFDVVAIQEIRATDQSIIPRFVEMINAAGRHYDYVIGPRLGRTSSKEQFAYIFDTASLQVDRSQVYTVEDPMDVLHREPLVAWFRVRGPDPSQAFTFSLVNVHVDPDEVEQEMNVMDDVFRAVRDDARGEDDVILLGDFNANESQIGQLATIPGITWAISGVTTNTRGTKLYDNLFMQRSATSEYTGRSGVYDFLRQFNLTLDEGLEVSDHLPVWAEFSIYEGGAPSAPVAAVPSEKR